MAIALPLWSDVLERYTNEVVDPDLDFQKEPQVKQWYTDGQRAMHQRLFGNIIAWSPVRKDAGLELFKDHPLVQFYLTATSGLAMTPGTFDYALPDNLYLLTETVLYPGTANEVQATEIPYEWDFRARNYPRQYGPTQSRPLWSRKNSGTVRFYLPTLTEAPAVAATYEFRYVRIPKGTYLSSGKEICDLPDAFTQPVLDYMLAQFYKSQETDPGPYLQMFEMAIDRMVSGPPQAQPQQQPQQQAQQ